MLIIDGWRNDSIHLFCCQARHSVEEFDAFTLDEVDKAFDMITQLKHNQTVQLKGKDDHYDKYIVCENA